MTFAALATVGLIIGLALAKPPAQPQASLPDEAWDVAPVEEPARPAPTPAPTTAATPEPTPVATPEPTPAPAEEAPPAEDTPPAPSPSPEDSPPAEDTPPAPSPSPEESPPAEDTAPVSTPAVDVNAAAGYVRAFYADLEQRNFHAAWPRLAEDLRASSGGYESWVSGFDTTLRQSTSDLVAKAVGPATVRVSLTLTAVDRDKHDCEVTRQFAVEWRLDFMGGKWRALHAEGKPIKSPPTGVAASCSAGGSSED